jgi:hypothetical protein
MNNGALGVHETFPSKDLQKGRFSSAIGANQGVCVVAVAVARALAPARHLCRRRRRCSCRSACTVSVSSPSSLHALALPGSPVPSRIVAVVVLVLSWAVGIVDVSVVAVPWSPVAAAGASLLSQASDGGAVMLKKQKVIHFEGAWRRRSGRGTALQLQLPSKIPANKKVKFECNVPFSFSFDAFKFVNATTEFSVLFFGIF